MAWGDARRARIDARAERRKARQEGRTARAQARQETTRVMAEQGMRRGQIVGDLVSKGLDIAGKRLNGNQADEAQGGQKSLVTDAGAGALGGLGMLLPVAVVGYLAMKKK